VKLPQFWNISHIHNNCNFHIAVILPHTSRLDLPALLFCKSFVKIWSSWRQHDIQYLKCGMHIIF
jgi:hypothetical protein